MRWFIYADGTHHVQTSVMVPKELYTFAKREGISLSTVLRQALEQKKEECEKGNPGRTAPSRNSSTTRSEALK